MTAEEASRRILKAVGEAKNQTEALADILGIVQSRDGVWLKYAAAERSVVSAGNLPTGSSRYARERFYRNLDQRSANRDQLKKELGV